MYSGGQIIAHSLALRDEAVRHKVRASVMREQHPPVVWQPHGSLQSLRDYHRILKLQCDEERK